MRETDTPTLQPLSCGGRNGIAFGIYLTLFYAASVFARRVPMLNLISLAMLIGAPLLLYRLLLADHRNARGRDNLGLLWLDGIMTVVGGALISGMFLMIYLSYINPGYLIGEWNYMTEALTASGDEAALRYAENMHRALDNGFTVSPGIFVMTLLWMAGFSGSLLSLIVAAVVRTRRVAGPPSQAT